MAFSLPIPKLDPRHFFGTRIGPRPRASGFSVFSGPSGPAGRILLGLGLGSLAAAAYAAIAYFRSRTPAARARSYTATAAAPESGPYAPRQQASMDWILSGRGMDTLVPAAYSIPEQAIPEQSISQQFTERSSRNPADFLDSGEAAQAAANEPPVDSVFSDPAPDAGSPLAPHPLTPQDSGFASHSESEPWTDTVRRAMEKKPLMFGYDKSAWTAPLLSQYLMETHGVAVPVPRLRNALRDMGYHWKHTHYVQARPGTGRHH